MPYTNNAPGLDRSVLGLNLLQRAWDLRSGLWWCCSGLEKVTEKLSLLFGIRWVPVCLINIAQ